MITSLVHTHQEMKLVTVLRPRVQERVCLSLSILEKSQQLWLPAWTGRQGEFRIAPRGKPGSHLLRQGEGEKDQRGQSHTELLQRQGQGLRGS